MWTRSGLAPAMLAAALLLALAVGTAHANHLRLTTTRFSLKWREFDVPVGQNEEINEGSVRRCPLTLSGTFHSATFAKVASALVGYVNAANMGTCSAEGGGAVMLLRTGLPWHLQYKEFSGTLPAIVKFRLGLVGFRMSIESPPLFGAVCLITSTASEPLNIDFNREAGGAITSAGGTDSRIVARDTTGFVCEGFTWQMGGTATFDNGSGARVTVTLI